MSEVKEFLHKNKPALSISRMNAKDVDMFKKMALEMFCDDYGQTLSFLLREVAYSSSMMKMLNNILVSFTDINKEITDVSVRVTSLEDEGKDTKNSKEIRSVNGKVIRRG